ncbi:MAG: neutral zinc metallopeptidase [Pseudomonadota bacterium]
MRWQGNRQSDNVEDVRGDESADGGAGRQGFSLGGGGLSLGTVAVALVASYFLGINPMTVLSLLSGGGGSLSSPAPTQASQGQSAMGPFYCPADHKVYIDLAFYDTLRDRLGAPGDFAQAYVIAHEVGHHVQNLLGTSAQMDAARGRVSKAQYNALSVRLELQADCLAGVWANHAQRSRQIIEAGDIEEALNAAAQIGDDTLQRKGHGQVVPESFTHGTSQQRMTWFKRGLDSGQMDHCNTFNKQPI